MKTDINRPKVVLAEKKNTNKWFCEQLISIHHSFKMVYE